MPPRLKLHIHFTKSSKRDNISKLCLFMPQEHTCRSQGAPHQSPSPRGTARWENILPNKVDPRLVNAIVVNVTRTSTLH